MAARHGVSCKFIYQQTRKAGAALDDAFASDTPDGTVLFELAMTKAWLRQLIVALALICRGSYRGFVEFLRDLLGVSVSLGCVHDMLRAAARQASTINQGQRRKRRYNPVDSLNQQLLYVTRHGPHGNMPSAMPLFPKSALLASLKRSTVLGYATLAQRTTVAAAVLSLALAGCTTRQALVAQHVSPVQTPPVYVPPKRVTQVQPEAITRSRWNIPADGCSEDVSLSSNDFGLIISDPKTSVATVSIRLSRGQHWHQPSLRTIRIKFDGSRGSWSSEGQLTKTGAVFGMTTDDAFLVKVMALLNGGKVDILAKGGKLLTVIVPSAGDRGQAWFECVRARIL